MISINEIVEENKTLKRMLDIAVDELSECAECPKDYDVTFSDNGYLNDCGECMDYEYARACWKMYLKERVCTRTK